MTLSTGTPQAVSTGSGERGDNGVSAAHAEQVMTAMFDLQGRPDPTLLGTLTGRDHPTTSRLAALHALPRTGTQRARVLSLLRNVKSGLTDEQMQAALALSPNSQRPRRVELVSGGWVKDSGLRRPTAMGCDSIVWVAV